jgi:hypothetical protein
LALRLAVLSLFMAVPNVWGARAQAAHNGATGPSTARVLTWDVCWVRGVDIRTDPLQMGQAVFYVSDAMPLFSMADYHDVPSAFARFVANKFKFPAGMTSTANCTQLQSLAEAQSFIKQYVTIPIQRGILDCKRAHCIMTDWTNAPAAYTPDQAAASGPAPATPPCNSKPVAGNIPCGAPASAPARPAAPVAVNPPPPPTTPKAAQAARSAVAPQPAAPQTPYAICWGELAGLNPVAYFSAPFEARIRNTAAWSAAFKEALRNKYKFAGVIRCPTMNSLAEAQQRAQQTEDSMRAHGKVVETGWKYE